MVPRRRRSLAVALLGLAVLVSAFIPLAAQEEAAQPLPAELLEARTVCLMDQAVRDSALRDRFRSALEEWERYEIVLFPDEADVVISLSAHVDYVPATVTEDCDADDPLCGRAQGTTQMLEKLGLKIFVQGGDELWTDEEPVDQGDEAAERLIERLRGRIEEAESGGED